MENEKKEIKVDFEVLQKEFLQLMSKYQLNFDNFFSEFRSKCDLCIHCTNEFKVPYKDLQCYNNFLKQKFGQKI